MSQKICLKLPGTLDGVSGKYALCLHFDPVGWVTRSRGEQVGHYKPKTRDGQISHIKMFNFLILGCTEASGVEFV